MSHTEVEDISLAQNITGQDVDDFLEEYNLEDCETGRKIEEFINKAEELRSLYRLRHNEYAKGVADYESSMEKKIYKERIHSLKSYLLKVRQIKKSLKAKKIKSESNLKWKSRNFLIGEVQRIIKKLKIEFSFKTKDFSDDQITMKKSEFTQYDRKLENISKSNLFLG